MARRRGPPSEVSAQAALTPFLRVFFYSIAVPPCLEDLTVALHIFFLEISFGTNHVTAIFVPACLSPRFNSAFKNRNRGYSPTGGGGLLRDQIEDPPALTPQCTAIVPFPHRALSAYGGQAQGAPRGRVGHSDRPQEASQEAPVAWER